MNYFYGLLISLLIMVQSAGLAQHVVLNKGVGGNNSRDLLMRIEKDVLAERPDLVIIMVGTNDMINSHKFISYTQYRENYQAIIRQLMARQVEVVLISPPPVDTGYVFQRHDRRLFTHDPNAKLDSVNHIVQQLACENKLHFVDMNKVFKAAGSPNREATSLIINRQNYGKADGIHPTSEGYSLMAEKVYTCLKKSRLLKGRKKILCLGDSMTYGSYMPGAGTAEGKTYPAYLHALINKKPPSN